MKSWTPSLSEERSASAAGRAAFNLARTLVYLSLFDTASTLLLVGSGATDESNPLMGAVLSGSPLLFVGAKLSLTWLGVALLGVTESVRALGFCVGVYSGVCVLHLVLLVLWVTS